MAKIVIPTVEGSIEIKERGLIEHFTKTLKTNKSSYMLRDRNSNIAILEVTDVEDGIFTDCT